MTDSENVEIIYSLRPMT